jgi:hypothetical protein
MMNHFFLHLLLEKQEKQQFPPWLAPHPSSFLPCLYCPDSSSRTALKPRPNSLPSPRNPKPFSRKRRRENHKKPTSSGEKPKPQPQPNRSLRGEEEDRKRKEEEESFC